MKKTNSYYGPKGEFSPPAPAAPQTETDPENDTQDHDEPESVTIKKNGRFIHCLTVIGQIEGHTVLPSTAKTTKYEHMIPRIVAVEESPDIDGLLLILNTVGGDVEAGLALSELIAGMKTPTVSLVLGGGHSIGIPLAVSADYSFIAPSATMTVHPVRMNGLVLGTPQTMAYFQNIQERIVDFVAGHSKIDPDRFRALMLANGNLMSDLGTILGGADAVSEGLIDAVGSLRTALEKLEQLIPDA